MSSSSSLKSFRDIRNPWRDMGKRKWSLLTEVWVNARTFSVLAVRSHTLPLATRIPSRAQRPLPACELG